MSLGLFVLAPSNACWAKLPTLIQCFLAWTTYALHSSQVAPVNEKAHKRVQYFWPLRSFPKAARAGQTIIFRISDKINDTFGLRFKLNWPGRRIKFNASFLSTTVSPCKNRLSRMLPSWARISNTSKVFTSVRPFTYVSKSLWEQKQHETHRSVGFFTSGCTYISQVSFRSILSSYESVIEADLPA